jgi:hypothetical protein
MTLRIIIYTKLSGAQICGSSHTKSVHDAKRVKGIYQTLEDLDIDVTIILKQIFKEHDRGGDRIELAQDRDRWRALVNMPMNLRIT